MFILLLHATFNLRESEIGEKQSKDSGCGQNATADTS